MIRGSVQSFQAMRLRNMLSFGVGCHSEAFRGAVDDADLIERDEEKLLGDALMNLRGSAQGALLSSSVCRASTSRRSTSGSCALAQPLEE